jgi:hypothetical protein
MLTRDARSFSAIVFLVSVVFLIFHFFLYLFSNKPKKLQDGRKANSTKKKELTRLTEELEQAIESRTDMELGLKSVRLKLDRSTDATKKLKEELKIMESVCDARVSLSKKEAESMRLALQMSSRKQETMEQHHQQLQQKFDQMKKMVFRSSFCCCSPCSPLFLSDIVIF